MSKPDMVAGLPTIIGSPGGLKKPMEDSCSTSVL
jgi:hypothetical protein